MLRRDLEYDSHAVIHETRVDVANRPGILCKSLSQVGAICHFLGRPPSAGEDDLRPVRGVGDFAVAGCTSFALHIRAGARASELTSQRNATFDNLPTEHVRDREAAKRSRNIIGSSFSHRSSVGLHYRMSWSFADSGDDRRPMLTSLWHRTTGRNCKQVPAPMLCAAYH